jgi:hypothetical protein
VSVFFMISFSISQKELNLHNIRSKFSILNKFLNFLVNFCDFLVKLTIKL